MTDKKLPAPWLRERDAAELEREARHLAMLRKFEAAALAAGIQIRLKKPPPKEKDHD